MSLYGSLFSGVSGLRSQSNKIGIISDNISNVNTVGYKAGSGLFQSLVTTAAVTSTYSPGGVLGGNRQLVSRQGLLQSTDSPTDIAISGGGFFVVNQAADQTGQVLYTRAGSFRQDSTGNFRNAAGFFLQAWPLDREGRLPGEPGNTNTASSANITSLRTVNVQNLTGVAASTSNVAIGANLRASQAIFPGSEAVAGMDPLNVANANIRAKDIIVPDNTGSPVNGIQRGDKFGITTGAGLSYTYRYGGFTFSRDISSAGSNGDNGLPKLVSPTTISGSAALPANPISTNGTDAVVTLTMPNHGLTTGDSITLANLTATGGISAGNLNGVRTVTVVNANTITFTAGASSSSAATGGGTTAELTGPAFRTVNASNTVTVRHYNHGLATGAVVTLSGVNADLNNVSQNDLNGRFLVTVTGPSTYTITTASTANAAGSGGSGTIISNTRPFGGNILDSSTTTQPFLATTGVGGFSEAGLSFKITTPTVGTVTFTYSTAAQPNSQLGQFNNLTNLAAAISSVNGLSARVVQNKLYVSATDANESITFTNGSAVGNAGPPVLAGIDWVRELGLADQGVGFDRFSTLEGLAKLVNASAGVSAVIDNPTSISSLSINVDDPLDTVTFTDRAIDNVVRTNYTAAPFNTTSGSNIVTINASSAHNFVSGDLVTLNVSGATTINGIPASELNGKKFEITVLNSTQYTIKLPATVTATAGGPVSATLTVNPPSNSGSLLAELGLVTSQAGAAFTIARTTGAIGPAYDPTNSLKNMASGAIPPQFSRPIRVFDSLGTGHDLSVNFIKIGVNAWAVEVFALPATDVTTSLPNGLLTYGTINFNGDSSLRSISTLLANPVNITWNNGAQPSTVDFNWGTAGQPFGTAGATAIGLTDGLSQFDSAYRVNFVNQNGAPVGELSSVAIDENGFIIASYSNGETQRLFKIPLADFANPDQLQAVSGNVFIETSDSGAVNLAQAGSSGVGEIAASTLEASNVELADQLTDMIVAQRAYQANTRVITTSDQLLEELNRILQ